MTPTGTFVTELFCPKCSSRFSVDNIITLCPCGSPLLVDYDYKKASGSFTPEIISKRDSSMWRYLELLPVKDKSNIVTLGEGMTPLLASENIGNKLKFPSLYFKDESKNPTGSFKARGLSMAVSKAKELGIEKIVIPTAGNAGSAVAAYCARANIECKIIMPDDTPEAFTIDAFYHGAEVEKIKGSIKDCGERTAKLVANENWFPLSTLKEPYRIEGKKTMGYEIAEQMNYELPDVIIYPTGGGTGLIGMWKAFNEMEKLGWIGRKRPKMISVQSEGCAPIVKAFENNKDKADLWEDPYTHAAGLRVPSAVGDFLILNAVRESNGVAIAVSEDDIDKYTRMLASEEGIFSAPEGGAAMAAVVKLIDNKIINNDNSIVIFITGSGYKYLDTLKEISNL
jgi:threonine synthase